MELVCKRCGSDYIICECWANPNTDDIDEYTDLTVGFCYNCGEEVEIIERK